MTKLLAIAGIVNTYHNSTAPNDVIEAFRALRAIADVLGPAMEQPNPPPDVAVLDAELTEIIESDDYARRLDLAWAYQAATRAALQQLREVCYDANAVCVCGCPVADHESYGEEGEACQDETHECIRTSKAVYAIVHSQRARLAQVEVTVQSLREIVDLTREGRSDACLAMEVARAKKAEVDLYGDGDT